MHASNRNDELSRNVNFSSFPYLNIAVHLSFLILCNNLTHLEIFLDDSVQDC